MPELRPIKAYRTSSGRCPFREWYWSVSDMRARAAISSRIDRLAIGNAGDCRSVQNGVYELRIHAGPGYRVYFAYEEQAVVLLLVGGDKSTQRRDIREAAEYLNDYRRRARGAT